MVRQLVDVRLGRDIPNHWPSLCTIQTVNFTASASNQPVPTSATSIAAKTNIPCRLSALIDIRPSDDEIRTTEVQEKKVERTCKLSGYYSDIEVRTQQAVVDGVTYQIRGVEHDSQQFSTRLRLEVIKP